ncbi:hypothetical protein cyc_07065 [Cyclospora cayetanensis]|uniref:Uncharacterized protein n=1 Tax=Cyclospora cayetanensis TaxID=88456 RepID=A0A1D3D440_9EIME|nr:hypothetical protein cyc_07065 [Cyclospora cayetanensis]
MMLPSVEVQFQFSVIGEPASIGGGCSRRSKVLIADVAGSEATAIADLGEAAPAVCRFYRLLQQQPRPDNVFTAALYGQLDEVLDFLREKVDIFLVITPHETQQGKREDRYVAFSVRDVIETEALQEQEQLRNQEGLTGGGRLSAAATSRIYSTELDPTDGGPQLSIHLTREPTPTESKQPPSCGLHSEQPFSPQNLNVHDAAIRELYTIWLLPWQEAVVQLQRMQPLLLAEAPQQQQPHQHGAGLPVDLSPLITAVQQQMRRSQQLQQQAEHSISAVVYGQRGQHRQALIANLESIDTSTLPGGMEDAASAVLVQQLLQRVHVHYKYSPFGNKHVFTSYPPVNCNGGNAVRLDSLSFSQDNDLLDMQQRGLYGIVEP